MHGQPFGYIILTLISLVSGTVLAVAYLFIGDFLEKQEAWIEFCVKAAVALLVWLPVVSPLLRSQAAFLAVSGGLPSTLRPRRVAWIIALATIPLVAMLDFFSEGKWMDRYHSSGGYLLPFWACFPVLVWVSVRASLGGTSK